MSCPVGRAVIILAFGSCGLGSIPGTGRTHFAYRAMQKNGSTLECELTCIGSIPLLGAAILFSIVNAKRNRNKFLANVETRKGLQLVSFLSDNTGKLSNH